MSSFSISHWISISSLLNHMHETIRYPQTKKSWTLVNSDGNVNFPNPYTGQEFGFYPKSEVHSTPIIKIDFTSKTVQYLLNTTFSASLTSLSSCNLPSFLYSSSSQVKCQTVKKKQICKTCFLHFWHTPNIQNPGQEELVQMEIG